jgi:hypothetical protein
MINDKFVQLHGPFNKNTELINIIKNNYVDFQGISRLGIQSTPTNICYINNMPFEIGKTGILECNGVNIVSLYFKQAEPATTIIDCLLN